MHERKEDPGYLDYIDKASAEKAGMCDHLTGLGQRDVVLEIGPGGGGALKELLARLRTVDPKDRPNVIAVDLSLEPLKRARQITEAANAELPPEQHIRILPVRANATNLPFADSSIAVVNISAIVHEIFSYAGGEQAVDSFIAGLSRIVRFGGNVVYRDPEGIDSNKKAAAFLKSPVLRAFTATFLRKYFMDSQKQGAGKPNGRYLADLKFSIDGQRAGIEDISIAKTTSAETVLFSCSAGMMHELKRHYVVFMTELFPEIFKTVTNVPDKSRVQCKFSRNSGAKVFQSFFETKGITPQKGEDERTFIVSKTELASFEAFTTEKLQSIYGEVAIDCENEEDCKKLQDFLKTKNIPYNKVDGTSQTLLPFEHLVLIYDGINTYASAEGMNMQINKRVRDACDWFEREGKESYFYGDAIDVLVKFVKKSLIRDRTNSAVGYSCLVPISPDSDRFIGRDHYAKHVSTCVTDIEGSYPDGKRNIHFIKKPVEEAFGVLFTLYQRNNDERLRGLLDELLMLTKKSLDTSESHSDKLTAEEALFREETDDVHVIGLAGGIASGKSSVGDILAKNGFTIFELSSLIRRELEDLGIFRPKRADFFEVANSKRRSNGNDYWVKKAIEALGDDIDKKTVISGIRTPEEVLHLRRIFKNFVLVAIDAPREVRIQCVQNRLRATDPASVDAIIADMEREMSDTSPEGCQLESTFKMADIIINTGSTDLPALRRICLELLAKFM